MTWPFRLFLVCALLLIGPVADATKLVAVLPLDITHARKKMDGDAQASLEEMLRDVATDSLASYGWTVLTGETMLQVLQDNGVNLEKCGDQNCHLSMAKEIKADKFISGSVQYVEGSFTASIRLIDTGTGRILASERVEGDTVKALRKSFESKAAEFFAKGGMIGGASPTAAPASSPPPLPASHDSGPVVTTRAPTAAVGNLTIAVRPKDIVRLVVTSPSGKSDTSGSPYKNPSAEPGRWKVVASADGYAEENREFTVPPDDEWLEKIELKPLGGLSITGTPDGAAVTVKGDGFTNNGSLPWEAKGIRSGAYHVTVIRTGYANFEKDVQVQPGETEKVSVKLDRAVTAPAPAAAPPTPQSKLGEQAPLPPYDRAAVERALTIPCGSDTTACFVQKQCKDDPKSCMSFASTISNGQFGFTKDPALAVPLYEYGCSQGDKNGCAMAAMAYGYAMGVTKDMDRARLIARHGCMIGNAMSCWNLRTSFEADEQLKSWASTLLRYQCDSRDATACWYGHGDPHPEWAEHADQQIRALCAAGDDTGCSFQKMLK